jgi:hypothetical protein
MFLEWSRAMAVLKIEEVFLYVSEVVSNSSENIQAMAFMDHSGIPYTKLAYNDPAQHPSVFAPLNSWWTDRLPPVDSFPLITYVEVHDDRPARLSPVQYLKGIEEIKTIVGIYTSTNG